MTDKEFSAHKRRLEVLAKRWLRPSGLGWWRINMRYLRDGLSDFNGGHPGDQALQTIAEVTSLWQYLKATISWNMQAVMEMNDKELERTFTHEICHIFINEMREWAPGNKGMKHEERVVETLAMAMRWIREEGERDAKKARKKKKSK